MKTAIKKTKMITMGLFSIFIMGSAQTVFANTPHQDPIELKAISSLNKKPMFELKVNNAEAGEFLVTVKDGNGDILYSETLKGTNVSRKYQLDINEDLYNTFNVHFEIVSVKTHEKYIYNVTRSTREVQEIIVAKL
ncbi:MAG TPA: hypothetical protein VIM07_08270 [Chitinophagaceae bacterium]